jgi:hypothetical protein
MKSDLSEFACSPPSRLASWFSRGKGAFAPAALAVVLLLAAGSLAWFRASLIDPALDPRIHLARAEQLFSDGYISAARDLLAAESMRPEFAQASARLRQSIDAYSRSRTLAGAGETMRAVETLQLVADEYRVVGPVVELALELERRLKRQTQEKLERETTRDSSSRGGGLIAPLRSDR